MAAEHRSAHPNLPGCAVVGCGPHRGRSVTADRLRVRRGFRQQGTRRRVRRALRRSGCVAAVLAVRQSGIFTAVIQPPLILFVAVPGAYFLFHGARVHRHQGHPDQLRLSADRAVPADVLHLGGRAADRDGPLVLRRWPARRQAAADGDAAAAAAPASIAGLAAKFGAVFNRDADERAARRRAPSRSASTAIDRPGDRATKRPRSGRPAKRAAPTRSRHARPPLDDITEPDRSGRAARPPGAARRSSIRPTRRRAAGRVRRATATRARRRPRRREPREPPASVAIPYAPPRAVASGRPRAVPAATSRVPAATTPYPPCVPALRAAARAPPPPARRAARITRSRGCGTAAADDGRASAADAASTSADRPSGGPDGSRAAARTPASRWRSSPAARCRSRTRPAAPARRAPGPRAPTRPT